MPNTRPRPTATPGTTALVLTMLIGAPARAGVLPYPVDSRTLDNGLQVHVVPMESADGVVAVSTWMAVGSRDEIDPGRTGFAHFFEHLMFYGTEQVDPAERERRLLRLAVEENAWTWFDETVYHAVLSSNNLGPYLELEADRFQNLVLTEADVRQESGAVYGEYRKNVADPGFVLDTTLQATAFTTHPYGHDTIGYEPDIAAMPTAFEYSAAFFDRHYRPDHATLLIVGDVVPDDVHALVERLYSGWEASDEPPREIPPEPEQAGQRRAHVPWPGPTGPRLVMAWKVPPHDPTSAEVAHLDLVAKLLLSPVGPLQQRLIREEAAAFAVYGGRDSFVDAGLFRVEVRCREAADLERAERIVHEEVNKLMEGPSAEALDATRAHERYALLTSLARPRAVASTLGWHLRRNPDPATLDTWFELLEATTPADIADSARTWLVDDHLTVVTLATAPPPEDAPDEDSP